MAFKEVQDLNCDVTVALGGRNKQGKANPTSAEGYFLGTRVVESKLSRDGTAKIHVFQTAEGSLGVWGKTDLDRKMTSVVPGTMTRVTQNGTVSTPKGNMYKYKVEVDPSNTIEVSAAQAASSEDDFSVDESDETVYEQEEEPQAPVRAAAPKQPLSTPSAAQQARVKALLGK